MKVTKIVNCPHCGQQFDAELSMQGGGGGPYRFGGNAGGAATFDYGIHNLATGNSPGRTFNVGGGGAHCEHEWGEYSIDNAKSPADPPERYVWIKCIKCGGRRLEVKCTPSSK